MKKLDNLLPFITLLMMFAALFMMGSKSFGAMVQNHSEVGSMENICTFNIHTKHKAHMKNLIPQGTYRIVATRSGSGYAYGAFQHLAKTPHGKAWMTLGKTTGGSKISVNLKKGSNHLVLYFNENKSKPGSCTLAGSLHGWS